MDIPFDRSEAILEALIQKMREVDAAYFEKYDRHVSMVKPEDVKSANDLMKYLRELFECQGADFEIEYGGNLGSKANVQVYINEAVFGGDLIKALANLMRMCKSVNFTSMNSGRVMIQFWVK